jgi:IS605 OrfB family transposase
MSEITYNIKLKFSEQKDYNFWLDMLYKQRDIYNFASNLVFDKKPNTMIKEYHDLLYNKIKEKFNISSQTIIRTEKDILSTYRSIKSNKHKITSAPQKKSLSLRLDQRMYSNFNKESIRLISSQLHKRCIANLRLYPKVKELFDNYKTCDPLIFYKNNEFYLSVTFRILEKVKQNEDILGLDLGCRRLITTSDGDCILSRDFNRQKRKIRYLKRILNSKKKNSHSARTKLKKLSKKEHNISKQYIEKSVNTILKNTNKSIIVIEDLTKIKQMTKKKYGTHNNRISQVPFYMFKQILSYKAPLYGKEVKTVNPYMTSQTDSQTGKWKGERKGCRFYTVDNKVYDADWNAAINIAKKSVKHPISYCLPLDGKLNILNRQVDVNLPKVSEDNIKLARP